MRTAGSGGMVHNSSASATNQDGATIQDVPGGTGSYLIFIGVFAGCFFVSFVMQPWHQQARFESQPQQMQTTAPPLAYQPVSPQQVYSQSNQFGTAYGGVQFVAQPPSYYYGSGGQYEMRLRTNVNR